MWKYLPDEWRRAFAEAWAAFKTGSIPIGAVICDGKGNILVSERNRTAEADVLNRKISHAEANAVRRLDTSACDIDNVVLYTTMEPCPMCMGTAVMSNIRYLRYAARDPYCGCVHWKEDDPYISGKALDYVHIGGESEFVQLVIQSYHELRCNNGSSENAVLCKFRELSETAVRTAEKLYEGRILDAYAENGTDFSSVYDEIAGKAVSEL